MKSLITTLLIGLAAVGSQAQLLTEKDLASPGYGEKKMKKAPKKVYINQFFVNYQVLSSNSENSGKAKASMAVGLQGIELEDMQELTDDAYEMVVEKLENAGFEIVEAEEAAKTEFYSDWQKVEGGKPSKSQLMGYVHTSPEDFEYFIKGVTKKGKEKKSTFFDTTPKLSKQVGDIPVFEANINFQFVTIEGSTFITDAVKMKGTVDYVMPASAIAQSSEGIFGSQVQTNPTMVRFVWKGGAPGAGALSMVAMSPKKDIDIPGVMSEKKFKEYVAKSSNYGSTSYGSLVLSERRDIEVSHIVNADREAFKAKTKQALEEYLTLVVDAFIANANG